jgi:hypothetical protein
MLCASRLTAGEAGDWSDEDECSAYLQGIDARQSAQLSRLRSAGVLEFEPVALPFGDNLQGNNWHLMHPVAAGDGQRMVVVFGRKAGHHGNSPNYRGDDQFSSEQVFVKTTDGGRTWSKQIDLRKFLTGKPARRTPGMRAIHYLGDDRLVYVGNVGVLKSEDFGNTWTHYPDALDFPDEAVSANIGPVIVEHPDFGLVLPAHAWRDGGQFLDETWFWISGDHGLTWQLTRIPTTTPSKNIEPAAVCVGDRLVFLARSHDPQAFDASAHTYRYSQGVTAPHRLNLKTGFTNILATDAGRQLAPRLAEQGYQENKARAFGFWSQDTVDLIHNPATNRLEAIVTNRTGRSGAHTDDVRRQSLGLWSIDPVELFAGTDRWKYEGTLYERHMLDAPFFVDGMHPAGSVVDLNRQVEHVFLYIGYYAGPSGIYRLTRSLNTPKLAAELLSDEAKH